MSKLLKSLILAMLLALLTGCGGSKPPIPGKWVGEADFGGIEFSIESDSQSAGAATLDLDDFSCGGVSISGVMRVFRMSGWDIDGGILEISTQFGPTGNDSLVITITFANSGESGAGEWVRTVGSSTCSGTFDITPQN